MVPRRLTYGYLGRRILVVCGQAILPLLYLAYRKAQGVLYPLDTMALWKFSDKRGTISLLLPASIASISSPRNESNGSPVKQV